MLTVRNVHPTDYPVFVECIEALETPDPVPAVEVFEARFVPTAFFVCEAGAPVGYGIGGAAGAQWHVMHVVTRSHARGRGVGRAVMEEHARRARAAGVARWYLNVKRGNAPAIRLYERCGMRIALSSTAMSIAWKDVAAMASSPDHEPLLVPPPDDAEVERTFGFSPGEVASHRARPGRVLVGVRAHGRIVAYASFDPAFPGAFPFRVADARYGHALLSAMEAHARPEHARVRLVAEGDEALTEVCLRAGAEVAMEMYRMEGEVPR